MSNPRPEKVAEVEELQKRLESSAVVILTDYRGLSVGEIGALRAKLRDAAIDYRVTKNTLLGRAAELAGVEGLEPYLVGPTAVVFGHDDPGAPARILQEFIRQYRKLEIKGGVVEGQALDPQGIQSLASLPTKLELVASLLGVIQGPMRGLVTVLTGPQRGLVTALDALRKLREEAGPAGAPSTRASEAVPATEAPVALNELAPAGSPTEAPVPASEAGPAAAAGEAPVGATEAKPPAAVGDAAVATSEVAPVGSASEASVAANEAGPATAAGEAPVGTTEAAPAASASAPVAAPGTPTNEPLVAEDGSPAGEATRTGS